MKRLYVPPQAKLIPEHATEVFSSGIHMSVWHWEQELFDGSTATFEMPRMFDVVYVIAEIDGKLVVCEEEQPVIGSFIGVPAGSVDFHGDEDELSCAKRELQEEAGYQLSNWKLIYAAQPNDRIEQFFYVFYAGGQMSQVEPKLDPGEKISHRLVEFDEFKKLEPTMRSCNYFREAVDVSSLEELRNKPDLYKEHYR